MFCIVTTEIWMLILNSEYPLEKIIFSLIAPLWEIASPPAILFGKCKYKGWAGDLPDAKSF